MPSADFQHLFEKTASNPLTNKNQMSKVSLPGKISSLVKQIPVEDPVESMEEAEAVRTENIISTVIGAEFCLRNFMQVFHHHPDITKSSEVSDKIHVDLKINYFGDTDWKSREYARQIKGQNPNGKIIIVLCDPITRVIRALTKYAAEHHLGTGL